MTADTVTIEIEVNAMNRGLMLHMVLSTINVHDKAIN
jgi:hypothetical protein